MIFYLVGVTVLKLLSLENDLQHEQEEHKQNVIKFSQEMVNLHGQISDLEDQLEHIRQEHSLRGDELDQSNKKVDELQRSLKLVTSGKAIHAG